jgi:hypothetical protein
MRLARDQTASLTVHRNSIGRPVNPHKGRRNNTGAVLSGYAVFISSRKRLTRIPTASGRSSTIMSFLVVLTLVCLGAVVFGALLIALAEYTVRDMPADQSERSNVHEFRRRP